MSSPSTIDPSTERSNADSDGLLEAVLHALATGVAVIDPDGRIVRVNHSAERIFGYVETELVGQSAAALFPEHLRDELAHALDTVFAGDRVDHRETEIQRKDGMPIPISLSLCPVRDGEAAIVAAVLVAADITEQRLAQATLAEVETRVRESEALAHIGSWLWDLRTGAVQWTDELHRIHGVEPLEFDGTIDAHLERVHPDDRARVETGMEAAVGSGRAFLDEYRILRPNGEERWVYSRAEPMMGSAATLVGLRGIAQDVTDRRSDAASAADRQRS